MSNKTIIGIDGGLNGGLCVLQDGELIELAIMPTQPAGNGRNEYDCHAIISFLEKYPEATIILEKAQYTPALGGISSFAFGKSYGTMIGILSALKLPYHIVPARTWQTKLFQGQAKGDTKAASKIIAQRLFPSQDFTATERSKKLHDGLTDATLIAYYGLHHL